jgi:hypothetical protein
VQAPSRGRLRSRGGPEHRHTKAGEVIWAAGTRQFRVVDVVPVEADGSPYVGLLRVDLGQSDLGGDRLFKEGERVVIHDNDRTPTDKCAASEPSAGRCYPTIVPSIVTPDARTATLKLIPR